MKLKIKEALFEANDVKQQVREFVENLINDTLDNLSQVVASKIPGYNADWCDSDGRSAVANKLVQNIDSLVDAIVAVLFSEIGELNEATERENKDKPLTESEVREYTNKILDLIDDGILSAETVALCALRYMSEDDVMAIYNDLIYDEDLDESLQEDSKPNNSRAFAKLQRNIKDHIMFDLRYPVTDEISKYTTTSRRNCEDNQENWACIESEGGKHTLRISLQTEPNYLKYDVDTIKDKVCEFTINLLKSWNIFDSVDLKFKSEYLNCLQSEFDYVEVNDRKFRCKYNAYRYDIITKPSLSKINITADQLEHIAKILNSNFDYFLNQLKAFNVNTPDESLSTKTNEAFRDDKLKNNFNESTVLNEDWSKGLLIKVNTTPESVKAACEQGKIEVPAVDEKGFENCYGETSLIVRFPDTNYKIFDYLNIYEEVCEFNYNLYDNEIKYEVDGGLSTINRIVKAQQIDDSVRSIIDMCVKKLTDAGIEVKDINVRIVGTKGEYKFTESLSESIDIAADKIIRRVTNYLENHPYDDNMDVEDICREVASNLLDADYDNMDGETSHSIFTAVSNYLDDKHNLSESIEDTKTIKDALNKTITGVNDNGLGSTGAFASWIAYGFDLDTMNIVDIAVAMDFDVYKTNMGYFGTPDYLIMFPGKPITSYPDFNEDFIEDDFKKIN